MHLGVDCLRALAAESETVPAACRWFAQCANTPEAQARASHAEGDGDPAKRVFFREKQSRPRVRTACFALAIRLAYARLRRRARPAIPRTRSSALVGSGTLTAAEGAVEPKKLDEAKLKSERVEVSSARPLIV